MARYLTRQYDTRLLINEDGDLHIEQKDEYGSDDLIIISASNILWFKDLIDLTIKDGYIEESDNETNS
jgi:hypothetical protein